MTISAFEPAPGYPVQAHADRLAGLFEVAFGLGEPVTGALLGDERPGLDADLALAGMGISPPRGCATRPG